MAKLGADDVQLDELARTFETSARHLLAGETSITTLLASTAWDGPDADSFRTSWRTSLRMQLRTTAERVGALAPHVRRQAADQRAASDAAGVVLGGGTSTGTGPGTDVPAPPSGDELDRWALDAGRRGLREASAGDDTAQRAWWDSLTDEQRAAIARTLPGELAALDGLPSSITDRARDDYVRSVLDELTVSSTRQAISGELDLAVVELSAEASATISRRADGTHTVELALEGELAADVAKSGTAGVGAGITQTYEFATQADAEAFVQGLYDRFDVDLTRAPWRYDDIPSEIAGGIGDHLDRYADHHTSSVGELKLFGGAEIDLGPGRTIELTGELGGTYDLESGERTVFLGTSFESELTAPLGPGGEVDTFSFGAELETSLAFDDDGRATSLTVSGSVEASTTLGLKAWLDGIAPPPGQDASFAQSSAEIGATADFTATFDLDDPFVQRAGEAFLARLQEGRLTNAELTQLLREGAMTITVDATATSRSTLDVVVAEVETTTTASENLVTWVKPAGGDVTFVTPAELREHRTPVTP